MIANRLLLDFTFRYPGRVALTILLGFSGAFFNGISTALIVPVLLQFLGQDIQLNGAPPAIRVLLSPFSGLSPDYQLALMTGVILFTLILKNASGYASTLVSSALKRTLTNDFREAGLRLLMEVDIDYYSKMGVGDLINRLNNEVSRTANAITTNIRSVTTVITILVFVALLISLSWQLTIASTVLLAAVTAVNQYAIGRSKKFGQILSEMSRAYSVSILEVLSGMRLVRSLANEETEYRRITKLVRDREQAEFASQANFAAIGPLSEVTGIVALILIVILGRVFLENEIQALSAVLLTYLFVLFRTLPLISQLNGARSQYANSSASVDVVKDFLRRDNKSFMKNGMVPFSGMREGIRFNSISFGYPGRDNLVLKGVNLYLPRGTTLALVGASGAGKSTMADLLPRFYDPLEGSITIDGRDLRDFDLKTLRRSMGIVSQDTFLFNATVRDNIAYGWENVPEEKIIEATKRANAYEFIVRMPEGFDTKIGDRGVLLSGGQRQRLAIARALLQNPEILILDEATSALDTVSERLVQAAIDDLSRDRTTLVIAHRLSTVQKAHQIAVMDQGQVVELGSHEELLTKGGYYARLCAMQLSHSALVEMQARRDEIARTSYEIRTRLNTMLGSLRLMVDGMVDTPEEQSEWTQEAYISAISMLRSLETLEQSNEIPEDLEEQAAAPALPIAQASSQSVG
jgi:ATP-binding cassette, subfamily B, bacterial MsbA